MVIAAALREVASRPREGWTNIPRWNSVALLCESIGGKNSPRDVQPSGTSDKRFVTATRMTPLPRTEKFAYGLAGGRLIAAGPSPRH